jgi:phospholipid/cholesterol/gamma-HCH transport system substrate-binding protein
MSREFRLGLFIVAALVILVAGVFLIGSKKSMFSSTYRVKANFQNVAGLIEGASVRVGGTQQGTVRRIDLPKRPDEKVGVTMDLEKRTREILKKDSVAAIKAEGLLGDKYVEISFGSPDAERLKDGETIAAEPPLDYADLIKKADEILDTSKDAVQKVEGTASNLESISSKIDQGKGTAGALVNDKSVYKEATAGAAAFRENMEALKHNFLIRGFFKKRGYEDSEELTKHEISKLPPVPSLKTFVYNANQIFDKPDSAKLKNEKALYEVGKFLEEEKFGLAVVAASAGPKGDSDKERVLTEARTMVVRDYLVQHFSLDDTRIKTIGLGKDKENGENGALEIMVYPVGSNSKLAQKAAPEKVAPQKVAP